MSFMTMGAWIRKYLLFMLLLPAVLITHAQDVHFSQFFEAPLLRNPALAGIYTGDVRVQLVMRDQWRSVTDAYRTGSLNLEYKMPVGKGDDFITAGGQLLYEKAGTVGLVSTHILPAFNYHKSLSDEKTMYLARGFMGGLIRKTFDITKMTTDEQYQGGFDPSLPTVENFGAPNISSWDGSVGLSFNTTFGNNEANSMFAGAAYHHLNRPKNSFYRDETIELNPKYVFSTGIKLRVNDYAHFIIQADHSIQGAYSQTIGGALYSYHIGDQPDNPLYTIHAGAFLRWKDALIPVLKIDKHPMSLAISYDVNVSPLKTASQGRGGFELSLAYIGFLNRENSSRDKVLCPKF